MSSVILGTQADPVIPCGKRKGGRGESIASGKGEPPRYQPSTEKSEAGFRKKFGSGNGVNIRKKFLYTGVF
jgi:hypothetical protein